MPRTRSWLQLAVLGVAGLAGSCRDSDSPQRPRDAEPGQTALPPDGGVVDPWNRDLERARTEAELARKPIVQRCSAETGCAPTSPVPPCTSTETALDLPSLVRHRRTHLGAQVTVRGRLAMLQAACYSPGCLSVLSDPDGDGVLEDASYSCCSPCSGHLGLRSTDELFEWSVVLRSAADPASSFSWEKDASFDCGGDTTLICCPMKEVGQDVIATGVLLRQETNPKMLMLASAVVCAP